MKNTTKLMTLAAVMVIGTAAFAGPRGGHHHHHKRDGLDLARGIVNLVTQVIRPTPTVVHRPAPVVIHRPAPAVIRRPVRRPAPPRRHTPPRQVKKHRR